MLSKERHNCLADLSLAVYHLSTEQTLLAADLTSYPTDKMVLWEERTCTSVTSLPPVPQSTYDIGGNIMTAYSSVPLPIPLS